MGSRWNHAEGAGHGTVTGTAAHVFTDRRHGDLALSGEPRALAARRAAIVDAPWTWVRQEHGTTVVTVTRPGEHAGRRADGAVTTERGAPLAVVSADCAPVLVLADGGVGVAHAGWRGLLDGVIEATVEGLAGLGAAPHTAVLGPCIRGRCYEFGATGLDRLTDRYGPGVRTTTAWGTTALDLAAGVAAACRALGLVVADTGTCTACSSVHWSHRARADSGRQALVAWIEP